MALLSLANKPLSPIMFVKLIFLLDKKTTVGSISSFYDFVPYKFGPFSFTLYRELSNLRKNGYVDAQDDFVQLNGDLAPLIKQKINELPKQLMKSINYIVNRFSNTSQNELLRQVYAEYPWFAINSELTEFKSTDLPERVSAPSAIYTLGYQNRSVEAFFSLLINRGIKQIIDVRANPISRRYGFAKVRMWEIAKYLGIDYQHIPALGISSRDRANLNSEESYLQLFKMYEDTMLPKLADEIRAAGALIKSKPTVLVCMETEAKNCHRGRLANSISSMTGLDIIHL